MAVHEWTVFYSQKKYDRWCAGDRHGYVTDEPHRYMYCQDGEPHVTSANRNQYFGEATMTTFLRYNGYYVWQERYKLARRPEGDGILARNNREELDPFMTLKVKRKLMEAVEVEQRRSGLIFKDPDVVAFDLDPRSMGLF